MILTRRTLTGVVRRGEGREETLVRDNDLSPYYVCVTRYDVQRTDHYLATEADVKRLGMR